MGRWHLQRGRSRRELPIVPMQELKRAAMDEISNARGREECFLRTTSELTTLVRSIGRTHGRTYFRCVLREVLGEQSKLHSPKAPHSPAQVRALAKSIIQRLAKHIHYAPLVFRSVCYYLLTEFRQAFPECKQQTRIVVGGVVFLRVLLPALINPETLGFPAHTQQSQATSVQVAKLLQNTLTGTLLDEARADSRRSNDFIRAFQPVVANFLERFPQIREPFAESTLHCSEPLPGPASCDFSSDPSPSPRTPRTPTTPDSPRSETQAWDIHPRSKMRGLSLSSDDCAMKHKRKFSLRFWNRQPAVSMSS